MTFPDSISRVDLHQLVWAKPLKAVAGQIGVSVHRLILLCKRHGVPRPSYGYFQLMGSETPLPIVSLSPLSNRTLEIIILSSEPFQSVSDEVRSKLKRLPKTIHPLLVADGPGYRKQKQYNPSVDQARAMSTAGRRQRAVLSQIFHAIEKLGGQVKGYLDGATAIFQDQCIDFELTEQLKTVHLPVHDFDIRYKTEIWKRGYRVGFEPTGILAFKIQRRGEDTFRGKWIDTEQSQLESSVPEIITSMMRIAEGRAARAEVAAKKQIIREARLQQEAARKAEDLLEKARWRRFGDLAKSWQEGAVMRDFIAMLKTSAHDPGTIVGGRTIQEWLEWSELNWETKNPMAQGVEGLFRPISSVGLSREED